MFEPKERVEILSGNVVKKRVKCLTEGNRVVIDKGGRGKGHVAWKPEYDESCFLYYHVRVLFWKILKRKLTVKEDALKCVSWASANPDVPTYDSKTAKKLFEAQVIKHAGASTQKVEVPLAVYLILGANSAFNLIQLYLFVRRLGF